MDTGGPLRLIKIAAVGEHQLQLPFCVSFIRGECMMRLILMAVLAIAFQTGCSATKFSEANESASSKGLSTDLAGDPASDDAVDSIDDEGDLENEEEVEEEDPIKEAMAEAACAKFRVDSANLPVVANYSANHVRDDVTISATILDLEDVRGDVDARSNKADIFNVRGSICLVGMGANAVGVVEDHRGRLEISGMNEMEISNTRGTLVIRGGNLKSITKHRGRIRLIGATVGSMNDIRGEISLEGGSQILGPMNDVK